MLNKITSFLTILGLIVTTNLMVLAQNQTEGLKNSQTANAKKDFFDFSERTNYLLEKDSFAKVDEGKFAATARQDDQSKQKKKFAGINTNTAIIIGAGLAAAIVIVLATKGGDNRRSGTIYCGDVRSPCP